MHGLEVTYTKLLIKTFKLQAGQSYLLAVYLDNQSMTIQTELMGYVRNCSEKTFLKAKSLRIYEYP